MTDRTDRQIIGNDTVHTILVEENGWFIGKTSDEIRQLVADAKAKLDEMGIEIGTEERQATLYYTTGISVENWLVLARAIGAAEEDMVAALREELGDIEAKESM